MTLAQYAELCGKSLSDTEIVLIQKYMEEHDYALEVHLNQLCRRDLSIGEICNTHYSLLDAALFCQDINADLFHWEVIKEEPDTLYLHSLKEDEKIIECLVQKLLSRS